MQKTRLNWQDRVNKAQRIIRELLDRASWFTRLLDLCCLFLAEASNVGMKYDTWLPEKLL